MKRGLFVKIDGLDGSGKGVAVTGLRNWAASKSLKVLDLREYWKDNSGFPNIDQYDVITSAEPTFTGVGKKIREEMVAKGSNHTAKAIAEAFAEDRKTLYKNVIIPALQQGKMVFQERGVVTSLVYQPLQEDSYSKEEIAQLEGNAFCLEHAPDLLILTVVEPEVVMQRLEKREKQDEAIFERLEFQKKVSEIYRSSWLKELFEAKGSKVHYLDTNPPNTVDDTIQNTISIVKKMLQKE
ncbi:hypothetical protein COV20_00135 [Candidatus Woesearchaeota archaeon CG10_big_fil_rev_8_21_14_0_10_45_16]|nr:MAG: hypothetical protein COV20_00135 [Candidatus Woesearchaeota archaeon CG10_big_fil_rev_8_21_14_0_10_45_16]